MLAGFEPTFYVQTIEAYASDREVAGTGLLSLILFNC